MDPRLYVVQRHRTRAARAKLLWLETHPQGYINNVLLFVQLRCT
jgi:hypothetical protein